MFHVCVFISINSSLKEQFDVHIEGQSKIGKLCRTWANILDRKDGTYIVRYKLYESCKNLVINVKYKNQHVDDSPYIINNEVHPEDCFCPSDTLKNVLEKWDCHTQKQLKEDLSLFGDIDWPKIRKKVPIEKYICCLVTMF